MAPEAKHFIRRIAVLTATKTNEDYSQVMCNIRSQDTPEPGYNEECVSKVEGKEGMDRHYI